ncbi:MAG: orotate phosphoribosyltransferase [Gammaproteobacteria bacterium]
MYSTDNFIQLCLDNNILCFGDFTLKSGRQSPYFFNAGLFHNGSLLQVVGEYFANALEKSPIKYDMLLGPAYKGIPLVSTTAIALATKHHKTIPYAYTRKEPKKHGEGGCLVGAPLEGKVVIIDDVITAGTAIKTTLPLIEKSNATLAGIMVIFDREEKLAGDLSAIQTLEKELGVPIGHILNFRTLINFMKKQKDISTKLTIAINNYRDQYGIA